MYKMTNCLSIKFQFSPSPIVLHDEVKKDLASFNIQAPI